VLDLRNNPGGLLDSAIAIASAFIEDGPLLIEQSGEDERVHGTIVSYVPARAPRPNCGQSDEAASMPARKLAGLDG